MKVCMLYTSFPKFRFLSSCQYFIDFIIHLQMCSYAAAVGFRAETLQDTKSIFTMHTGKGVRVHYSNGEISPSQLLKTVGLLVAPKSS
jgi:hypothetical protein